MSTFEGKWSFGKGEYHTDKGKTVIRSSTAFVKASNSGECTSNSGKGEYHTDKVNWAL